jgi:hypothetical protein
LQNVAAFDRKDRRYCAFAVANSFRLVLSVGSMDRAIN